MLSKSLSTTNARNLNPLVASCSRTTGTRLHQLSNTLFRAASTVGIQTNHVRKHKAQGLGTSSHNSAATCHIQRRYFASPSAAIKQNLAKTPLYDLHTSAGARMVPFAGFSMPLDYPDQSHQESHHWTRNSASLFDVSHMVQHRLTGPLAEKLLMHVTPSSIDTLKNNSSTLSVLLNDQGGIVDDTVITRLRSEEFYFVTNAGRRDADMAYLRDAIREIEALEGSSADKIHWEVLEHHGLLAIQGPKAAQILQSRLSHSETDSDESDLSTLSFGQSRNLRLAALPELSLLVTRTGYTGEDGFEISIPASNESSSRENSTAVAHVLLGDHSMVKWAGLAARDSLRLEAGMCLYGHDMDESATPSMTGLAWIVGKSRRTSTVVSGQQFKGQDAVLSHIEKPSSMPHRRVGMFVDKGPVAREGAEIVDFETGESVGKVTSGCPSPSLGGRNIAMGMVRNGLHKQGTKLGIKVRSKVIQAEVTKMPFVESRLYRI